MITKLVRNTTAPKYHTAENQKLTVRTTIIESLIVSPGGHSILAQLAEAGAFQLAEAGAFNLQKQGRSTCRSRGVQLAEAGAFNLQKQGRFRMHNCEKVEANHQPGSVHSSCSWQHEIIKVLHYGIKQSRRAIRGGIWAFPPKNFKTLHSNFDICRNFKENRLNFWCSNHLEKAYLKFSLSDWLIISLQNLSWVKPSDRNFIHYCYLTTSTLELSKLPR